MANMASDDKNLSPIENCERRPEPDDRSVAIVAIHGVGQHLPGASAEAISTLLMSIGRNGVGSETSAQAKQTRFRHGFLPIPTLSVRLSMFPFAPFSHLRKRRAMRTTDSSVPGCPGCGAYLTNGADSWQRAEKMRTTFRADTRCENFGPTSPIAANMPTNSCSRSWLATRTRWTATLKPCAWKGNGPAIPQALPCTSMMATIPTSANPIPILTAHAGCHPAAAVAELA